MNGHDPKRAFSSRPTAPDAWVRSPDKAAPDTNGNTARLTIDVTPALRGRIKVIAFGRGQTIADMLRTLLEREFPDIGGAS